MSAPHSPRRFLGPIRDVAHDPRTRGIAHRTKEIGAGAEAAREYIDAALQDPRERAVRVWVEIGPDLTGEP